MLVFNQALPALHLNDENQGPDDTPSSFNAAINALHLAGDMTSMKLAAKGTFGSASVLLTAARVCSLPAHVGLGPTRDDVCETVHRGVDANSYLALPSSASVP